MYFALINNNLVDSVVINEDESLLEILKNSYEHVVKCEEPLPNKGWFWDPETNKFSAPVSQTSGRLIPSDIFKNRFNFGEKAAILNAAATDAGVNIFVEEYWNSAKSVPLDSADFNEAFDYLISKGLVSQERKESLLFF